jgi:hypothetical protein
LRPGFSFPVRVGFGAFSGIAHVVPNLTAPSMRPALQDIFCKHFAEAIPDCPFGIGDIIFDFAPPSKVAARYCVRWGVHQAPGTKSLRDFMP